MTRCPRRTSAFGSAPEMSARPPVLTKGAISGVTNATCSFSDKSCAPRENAQASTSPRARSTARASTLWTKGLIRAGTHPESALPHGPLILRSWARRIVRLASLVPTREATTSLIEA